MNRKSEQWVLGISASHNGAACLLKGDEIVVSIQEERLSRLKRDKIYGGLHSRAVEYCLEYAGIEPADLSMVVLSAMGEADSPLQDIRQNPFLEVERNEIRVLSLPHHYAHAISAFATSGLSEAAVLVVDGLGSMSKYLRDDELKVLQGEAREGWEMISLYAASGTSLKPLEKHLTDGFDWHTLGGPGMSKFRSLGSIFSCLAEQIFGEVLDAGKVMGLAPYGAREFPVSDFFNIVNGSFCFQDKLQESFQHTERWPSHQSVYQNLSCSAQAALEDALLYLVNHLHELYPSDNLCYAGGVALNSVANERLIRETPFKNIYIVPAAEDSGPAIGAAYYGLWQMTGENSRRKLVHDAVGREYALSEIARAVELTPGVEVIDSEDFISDTVELLCEGKNLGWFQGRSELGPRALGQRSIICDPRRADAKEILNSKVKHREAFRPFAPAILLEESSNWFEWDGFNDESPFMLRIAQFKKDKLDLVPAVVHVDGTGRVQTLTREANGPFYRLVEKFYQRTGVPILLNTSFNVMGMPIIETPSDALFCLLSTGLDYCVMDKVIVKKRAKILLGQAEDLRSEEFEFETSQTPALALAQAAAAAASSSSSDRGYAGTFEHQSGTLIIEQDGPHLRGNYRGMSTLLRHSQGNTYIATDRPFNQSRVTFLTNQIGEVDRILVLDRAFVRAVPGLGKTGAVLFTRAPEGLAPNRSWLEQAVGAYTLPGHVIEVAQRSTGKLVVTATNQPDYELVHDEGAKFKLKNTPLYFLEFKMDTAGRVRGLSITQPNGVFTLKKG
jgi:carbamoyltransferase